MRPADRPLDVALAFAALAAELRAHSVVLERLAAESPPSPPCRLAIHAVLDAIPRTFDLNATPIIATILASIPAPTAPHYVAAVAVAVDGLRGLLAWRARMLSQAADLRRQYTEEP